MLLLAIPGVAPARAPSAPDPPVAHGPRTLPQVALTFDADFVPAWRHNGRRYVNDDLIRLLETERVHATLFMTGLWAQQYPDEMRRLVADGLFEFANHTYKHAAMAGPCFHLPVLAHSRDRDALTTADRILARFTDVRPRYMRFPGGCYDPTALENVREAGYTPVGWDVNSGDAFIRDPAVIAQRTLDAVRPGSIVVAHLHGADRAPATAEAFARIIPILRARGYQFVTVTELLSPPRAPTASASPHGSPTAQATLAAEQPGGGSPHPAPSSGTDRRGLLSLASSLIACTAAATVVRARR